MASQSEPLRARRSEQRTCGAHGGYSATEFLPMRWTSCPACAAAEEAERCAREARERAERAVRARVNRLKGMGVAHRYMGRTFADFSGGTQEHRHALAMARSYVDGFTDHWREGRGLVFAGPVGTGKTLMVNIMLQALPTEFDTKLLTAGDLLRTVRGTWSRGSEMTEAEVLDQLGTVDLLVLDEVGAQLATEAALLTMFEVLDRRYRNVRPTILCTNEDQASLRAFLGAPSFDRLIETCRWVPLTGPSQRARASRAGGEPA